jgi:hypothetical protein
LSEQNIANHLHVIIIIIIIIIMSRYHRHRLACFFLSLSFLLSTCCINSAAGIKLSANTWNTLRTNPNPVPSIEELESTTTFEEIDSILNRFDASLGGGTIIQGYRPEAGWLWKQWFGTVLVHSAPTALFNMCCALLFCLACRFWTHRDLNVFTTLPTASQHPLLERLLIIDKIWKTLMSLTTFLLTFFVGQAYTFWRTTHDLGRGIQGRFHDIHMLLATHATRDRRTGHYTPEAYTFLMEMQHQLRAFHLLFWASNATRFRVLLTSKGLGRMVERGVLRPDDLDRLQMLDLAPTQAHVAFLESAIVTCSEALCDQRVIRQNKNSHSTDALEKILLEMFCRLRGTYGTVGDMVDGRMPLAYAHFVQILVDSFLFLAPIAQ